MANCCQGNECNHIITIGYLKDFIGTNIHSSTDDSVLSVNYSDDTYCPTYSELTGGTLIQNWQAGTTPNGDTDGIVVGGTYAANQCVQQQDLSMKYTRFKSLTIATGTVDNPSNNCTGSYDACINECGGCVNLSFSHLYTRYTKSMNGSCSVGTSSSEASDTASAEVTWSETGAGYFSGNKKYCFDKNGTVSSSTRCASVSSSISFRSSTKTSNTLTICQAPLTGDYVYWKGGSSAYTDYDNYVISPWNFDCDGGTWHGTAYYSVHTTTWDVYRWKDSCNVDYDRVTEIRNKVGPTTTSSYTESHGSGTVSSVDCKELPEGTTYDSGNVYESYTDLGVTRSDYWRQTCVACPDCQPYTAYSYTDKTVDCSVGSTSVPYSWTAYTTSVDESGTCVYTADRTGSGSYNVSWECSTAGGWVDPHVNVTGAPCCASECVYVFDDVQVECQSANSFTKSVGWTCVCSNPDGTTTTTTGTANKTIPAVECNPNNSTRVVQNGNAGASATAANPRVIQKAGPCCDTPVPCTEGLSATVSTENICVPADHWSPNNFWFYKTTKNAAGECVTESYNYGSKKGIWLDNDPQFAAYGYKFPDINSGYTFSPLYWDGSNFFTYSGGASSTSAVTVTANVTTVTPCPCPCTPGTDNNMCNEPFALSCDGKNGFTSDSYMTSLGIYGSKYTSSTSAATVIDSRKNVTSYVVPSGVDPQGRTWTTSSDYAQYIEFLDGDALYEAMSAKSGVAGAYNVRNSYGARGLENNYTDHTIFMVVKHEANVAGVCTEWFSVLKYNNCAAPGCTVTLNMSQSIPAAGVSNSQVGTYTLGGVCQGTPSVAFVSGNNFLTINSVSGGIVYGTCAANSSTSEITGTYRLTYGTATSNSAARQLGNSPTPPPTPTTHTYTVNCTNDNANGATAGFFYNGTLIASGTIVNRTCTVTVEGNYAMLSVGIQKTGCDTAIVTVPIDSSASFTMSCGVPCSDGSCSATGACVPYYVTTTEVSIGTWTKTPGCTDNWIVDPSRSISGTNFLSDIRFDSSGVIVAKVSSPSTAGSPRWCEIPVKLGSITSSLGRIWQCGAPNPCDNTNVTATITATTFGSCGSKQQIGTYSYNCTDFDVSKLSGSISWNGGYTFGQITFENGGIYMEGTKNFTQADRNLGITIVYNSGIIGNTVNIVQPYNRYPRLSIDEATVNHTGGGFPVYITKDCEWTNPTITSDTNFISWTLNGNTINVSCEADSEGSQGTLFVNIWRTDGNRWQGTVDITWV